MLYRTVARKRHLEHMVTQTTPCGTKILRRAVLNICVYSGLILYVDSNPTDHANLASTGNSSVSRISTISSDVTLPCRSAVAINSTNTPFGRPRYSPVASRRVFIRRSRESVIPAVVKVIWTVDGSDKTVVIGESEADI